ncbi:MarR family winged helix-turn-helix transcriptional regulator [Nocardia sp. NPDC050630]|uniref:MarR family winged helix-turn-helix transcriptional regulator n=1 Tax=Nocardia sp. NPDC050630 TaxID=3364321 RepID=UPI0037B8D180
MISDRPSMYLAFAGQQAMARIHEVFSAYGLKQGSSRALSVLAELGPLSQKALQAALGCDPSIVVAILNQLEEMGLAERRRDPADRRRHIVTLLPAGVDIAKRIAEDLTVAEESFFAALTPGEIETLVGLLAKVTEGSEFVAADTRADDAC